ncbi:substrate-binding domain-containing protein [Kineococcus sp. R8]|uniref:LacI family DNA-binding transcriptional regulator n=1 Tax=Kineococcus siccus TaxID=2696567 RepID=UPI0014122CAF|nr:LacI family DNA-binding transcriptional regulator [Kineococcus siccus]NAZ81357.1 substrate-binding domain-containing protein [Kineococcus siccus]
MAAAPTVYDVATLAGVSTATVSRYFRQPDKVAVKTREAVRSAVLELGYLPSGSARGLAERRTGALGMVSFGRHEDDEFLLPPLEGGGRVVVVRDDDDHPRLYPLFADEVFRGVELECTIRGFPLFLGWNAIELSEVMVDAVAGRVDGLVVLPQAVSQERLDQLVSRLPVVLVSDVPPKGSAVSSVTVDNAGGTRTLVEHLVGAHGFDDLWFVGEILASDTRKRFSGYRQALRAAGLAAPAAPQLRPWGRADAREMLAEVVQRGAALPRAVVCGTDQNALGVVDALQAAGIDVPGDVAVTGFDGIAAGRVARPRLTTVRQPMDALGRVAVRILVDQVGLDERTPVHRRLPVQVVLRESCGCRG